jgi:hypothetical protein
MGRYFINLTASSLLGVNKMFYLYRPGLPVPTWLQKVEPKDNDFKMPSVFNHNGYGVVVKRKGGYFCLNLIGRFATLSDAYNLRIVGGGRGVIHFSNFREFIGGIKNADKLLKDAEQSNKEIRVA